MFRKKSALQRSLDEALVKARSMEQSLNTITQIYEQLVDRIERCDKNYEELSQKVEKIVSLSPRLKNKL